MPAKPVIVQRTPCVVEVSPALSIDVSAIDQKRNRFTMDPILGRSSRRWTFILEEKKRVAFCGCK